MNTRFDPLLLRPARQAPLLLRNPCKPGSPAPIGQILMELGELSPGDMVKAIAMSAREDTQFGDILLANHMVSELGLFRGLSFQYDCDLVDLTVDPPDPRLIDDIGPEICLKTGIIPWKRVGNTTLLATSRPEEFARINSLFPPAFGDVMMVIAPASHIETALLRLRDATLAHRAETRVQLDESCRNWNTGAMARLTSAMAIALAAGLIAAPDATWVLLTIWAIVALIFNTGLKASAAWVNFRAARPTNAVFQSRRRQKIAAVLPKFTILVALYKEREIASRLVRRLNVLNYPRELLDICLIVEQDDGVTQAALRAANLPPWMRQIRVPRAELKTKPRALNYALDFAKGSIIGVYDAEDAPEPDQLYKVARRFHECGPDVACLQGILDFYNPRTNWLSRCFTIEYATWFRVVLPGLERLGFIVPLGGTTIFFRRDLLEDVGGWDAHNVTEDADLGVRLARRGYRTELIPTLTQEEANCRTWPWIRQRSRWLKGYAITWAVHMRDPAKLLREIGGWRFFGFQILFLGALSQFLLAPFLWSLWLLLFGIHHPLVDAITPTGFFLVSCLFFLSEIVTIGVGIFALDPVRHRRLWLWVPTLHLYFPLAAVAAYKGIWELVSKPFYWDKTTHGQGKTPKLAKGPVRFSPPRILRRS